jgi:hypothetical protein
MQNARPHLPLPSAPVDGPVTPVAEPSSWAVARRLPVAAFVFAVLGLGYTAYCGYHSEQRGMDAAWIPAFPLAFGVVTRAKHQNLAPGQSPVPALGWGVLAGVLGVAGLWFFFAAIWRSL